MCHSSGDQPLVEPEYLQEYRGEKNAALGGQLILLQAYVRRQAGESGDQEGPEADMKRYRLKRGQGEVEDGEGGGGAGARGGCEAKRCRKPKLSDTYKR